MRINLRPHLFFIFALLSFSACRSIERRRPAPPPSPLAKAIIRTARSYLPEEETPHQPPKDCSDFVGKVFSAHDITLPRSSEEMAKRGIAVSSSYDLRMADLVFFSGSKGGRTIGHVGIYYNNGTFIHQANPGEGVRIESMYNDYYRKRYLKARRIIK